MGPEGIKHIDRMWFLENDAGGQCKKVLFALKTWRAQRKEYEEKEVRRKSDVRELKSEIYSLIGFYSVFQGVMFQGVSQLTLSCKYRIMPVLLSVFASVATIAGVYLKFSDITGLQEGYQKDKEFLQVLGNRISKINHEGVEFSFKSPTSLVGSETPPEEIRRIEFEKHMKIAKFTKFIVLLYLFFYSVAFAYVISVIMCKDY